MRKWLCIFAVFFAGIAFASGVTVETLDEQLGSQSLTVLRFRINNETSFTMRNVRFEFFVRKSSKKLNVDAYYWPYAQPVVQEFNDTISVVVFELDSVPTGITPNTSGYSVGIHYADWSIRDKSLDYSNPGMSTFLLTDKIALYVDGTLVSGCPPAATLETPEPDAGFVLQSGATLMLDDDEFVPFHWHPSAGYANYRLTIMNEDSSLVHQQIYRGLSAEVPLQPGRYLWGVQGVMNDSPVSRSSKLNILNILLRPPIKEKVVMGIPSYASGKDTELLVTSWGEFADLRGWDKKHDYTQLDEADGKCWAIAIQELNHFYGGNLPLDEIVAWSKINVDRMKVGPSLGAFMLQLDAGGNEDYEISFGLNWALGFTPKWIRTLPSKSVVQSALRKQKPLYINTDDGNGNDQHAMVVDGFITTSSDEFYIHFLNIDNYGHSAWAKYEDSSLVITNQFNEGKLHRVTSYAVIDTVTDVKKTDSLVFKDSDGDGLMDFDEIYRFMTDPNDYDSDDDGINDKIEIYSYTIRQRTKLSSKTFFPYFVGDSVLKTDSMMSNLNFFIMGLESEPLANVDGDTLRAERDPDSDNDGIMDGMEDLNHNGLVDEGESDPYVYDGFDGGLGVSMPKELALYSFDYIWLNDGVSCRDGIKAKKACAIASEGENGFAVIVGATSSVYDIYSKGLVWLRSNARVDGFIRYYGLPGKMFTTKMQKGAVGNREFNNDERLWPWRINVYSEKRNLAERKLTVQSGKRVELSDGDTLETLKVESGGCLALSIGRIVVNNLQLEPGSKIEFKAPGNETTLQVNGNVIWRTEIEKNVPLENIARGFRLAYYGTEKLFIEGDWAGFIYAPNAKIVLGQTKYKTIYGQILGNGISVHQYAKIFKVVYKPNDVQTIAMRRER